MSVEKSGTVVDTVVEPFSYALSSVEKSGTVVDTVVEPFSDALSSVQKSGTVVEPFSVSTDRLSATGKSTCFQTLV